MALRGLQALSPLFESETALKTRRSREEGDYAKRREALEAQLVEQRIAQEKVLGDRESAVAARENELADYQDQSPAGLAD